MGFHDRVAYGGDTFEKVLSKGCGGAWQGLNEYLNACGERWMMMQDFDQTSRCENWVADAAH